ncbi:MAG: ABC transporter ATP-binding protein [Acidobacteriaceae bacterium]|nr:ABC transporter ATP-binding protein [Acidobacteriaceae bacterium]
MDPGPDGYRSRISTPVLSIRGLRKSYKDVVAVAGLDIDAFRCECLGVLGPNGAGKTTVIEICEGLTKPDSGTVRILGMEWTGNAHQLRHHIGVQLQDTHFSEKLTVQETLRLFRSFYRQGPPVLDLIGMVQLEEKCRVRVGALSGGQKQRLAIACALAGDPEILFLDEPTAGLDPQARRQLWDLVERLKEEGVTIILTTHYMDEAERLCDRVAIMDHGRIIALGTPHELIASMGVEHMIEFALGDGSDQVDCISLGGLDGVVSVEFENSRYRMSVSELHRSVPALLAELSRQRIQLTELRTRSATLEDVFVSLTGRNLRDD